MLRMLKALTAPFETFRCPQYQMYVLRLGKVEKLDFHLFYRCGGLGGWEQCILGSQEAQNVKGLNVPFCNHPLALV